MSISKLVMTEVLGVSGDKMTIRINVLRSDDGTISRQDKVATLLTGESWELEKALAGRRTRS